MGCLMNYFNVALKPKICVFEETSGEVALAPDLSIALLLLICCFQGHLKDGLHFDTL